MKAKLSFNFSIIKAMGESQYGSNLAYIVCKEAIQNSIDAQASNIEITTVQNPKNGDYTFSIVDNGIGIDNIAEQFLMIGNEHKGKRESSEDETIGGFGQAKLAFLCCKNWTLLTTSGYCDASMLENELDIDESNKLPIGTILTLTVPATKIGYSFNRQLSDFMSLIDRKSITFKLNGNVIEPKQPIEKNIQDNPVLSVQSCFNGSIVVRVNGLPTIIDGSVYNLTGETLLYDIHTTVSPYSEEYPLTSNRESLKKETQEYKDYQSFVRSLNQAYETIKQLENLTRENINPVKWRGKSFFTGNSMTVESFDEYSYELSAFKRYVCAILDSEGYSSSEYGFGLSDNQAFQACYMPAHKVFLLNPTTDEIAQRGHKKNSVKGLILSLAIHESIHAMGYSYHDESFTTKFTYLNGKVLTMIVDSEFRW